MISADVLEAAGITYRQLDYWTRNGLVHADRRQTRPELAHLRVTSVDGSGVSRTYADDEAAVIIRMAALVRCGIDPRRAVELARDWVTGGGPVFLGEGMLIDDVPSTPVAMPAPEYEI